MEKKKRILFIDDEPDILYILGIRLKSLGYEVFGAASGDEGISLALQKRPGLIFVDLLMPGKDGRQVCREIRTKAELRGVPLVLFTAVEARSEGAVDKNAVKEMAEEAGANDYLIKPFEHEDLLEKINKFLGEKE